MNIAEGVRRGAVAQHDERRRKTMRATRFRRAALFAERIVGTGKKVKGREIDVAPWFCAGTCASKAANHWQATAPRRAPVASAGLIQIRLFQRPARHYGDDAEIDEARQKRRVDVCNGEALAEARHE